MTIVAFDQLRRMPAWVPRAKATGSQASRRLTRRKAYSPFPARCMRADSMASENAEQAARIASIAATSIFVGNGRFMGDSLAPPIEVPNPLRGYPEAKRWVW